MHEQSTPGTASPAISPQPATPEATFAVVLATDRLLDALCDYLADPTPCANAALMQIVDDCYEKLETCFEPLGITPLARRRLAHWVVTALGVQALDTDPERDDPYALDCGCGCHGAPDSYLGCVTCHGCAGVAE